MPAHVLGPLALLGALLLIGVLGKARDGDCAQAGDGTLGDDTGLLQAKRYRKVVPPEDYGKTSGKSREQTLEDLAKQLWKQAEDKAAEEVKAAAAAAHSYTTEAATSTGVTVLSDAPPSNAERTGTDYDWCDCGTGASSATFWAEGSEQTTVFTDGVKWVKFSAHVKKVHWTCDGMGNASSHMNVHADQWLSLHFAQEKKDTGLCTSTSGRLYWNIWSPTNYVSSVPFTTGTEGYACFKIPAMLTTQAGTIIAFAEARTPDCDDFARTDTVYKRSSDGGKTWGPLQKLIEVSGNTTSQGLCGHDLVIGNIAPVQLRQDSKKYPGRILVPYTRNNFRIYQVYSDDDGVTFVGDRELPNVTREDDQPDCNRSMESYFGIDIDSLSVANAEDLAKWVYSLCALDNPYDIPKYRGKLSGPWQFVGMGPPGSIQLRSGRVVAPGYRSYIRGLDAGNGILPTSQLYNNFAVGFVLVSDDEGDTWQLEELPIGEGGNENQLVELADGSVLSNSRALATGSPQNRTQARSSNFGKDWTASYFVPELPQPFNGCQGSTVGGPGNAVYSAVPDPPYPDTVVQKLIDSLDCGMIASGRRRLTLFESLDGGATYPQKYVIDGDLSAQTSLQYLNGKLVVLYEQADPLPTTDLVSEHLIGDLRVLLPTRFIYRELDTLLR